MPTPTPSTDNTADTVLHSIWTGITHAAAQNPWLVVVFGLLIVTAMVRSVRVAIHSGPRDAVRLFTRTDKALLLARAGHRCERQGWIGGRCRSTEKLEADHVHPWSRGGSTHVSNGQILCKNHNQAKKAGIPWDRTLRRLEQNRAGYYPADTDCAVVRKPERRQARNRHYDAKRQHFLPALVAMSHVRTVHTGFMTKLREYGAFSVSHAVANPREWDFKTAALGHYASPPDTGVTRCGSVIATAG